MHVSNNPGLLRQPENVIKIKAFITAAVRGSVIGAKLCNSSLRALLYNCPPSAVIMAIALHFANSKSRNVGCRVTGFYLFGMFRKCVTSGQLQPAIKTLQVCCQVTPTTGMGTRNECA
jgi:hypothetical protein